ncbi:hypothetical protein EV215_0259 [Hypnocyclicus thermotrophus]|uniref:Uncharacterized protein n=1 Tax=Hypnocyclicus thermotrophus TaxID=1627895 RepID=A0AA46E177_9FUSO|nr:hypothetical protein [Hypnocyclicus thermotrophus]TDT72453.1 hypothetical protein EV215_0259 [Hypnocyclicus thermotrophus]
MFYFLNEYGIKLNELGFDTSDKTVGEINKSLDLGDIEVDEIQNKIVAKSENIETKDGNKVVIQTKTKSEVKLNNTIIKTKLKKVTKTIIEDNNLGEVQEDKIIIIVKSTDTVKQKIVLEFSSESESEDVPELEFKTIKIVKEEKITINGETKVKITTKTKTIVTFDAKEVGKDIETVNDKLKDDYNDGILDTSNILTWNITADDFNVLNPKSLSEVYDSIRNIENKSNSNAINYLFKAILSTEELETTIRDEILDGLNNTTLVNQLKNDTDYKTFKYALDFYKPSTFYNLQSKNVLNKLDNIVDLIENSYLVGETVVLDSKI